MRVPGAKAEKIARLLSIVGTFNQTVGKNKKDEKHVTAVSQAKMVLQQHKSRK